MSFPNDPVGPPKSSNSVKFVDPPGMDKKKSSKKKFLKRGEGNKYDPQKAKIEERNKKKIARETEMALREEIKQ